MKPSISIIIAMIAAAAAIMLSINEFYAESSPASEKTSGLKITYPRDSTVFPPEIAPPTILWEDNTKGVKKWKIVVNAAGEKFTKITDEKQWKPERGKWQKIKSLTIGNEATVIVTGYETSVGENPISNDLINFLTSEDSVGAPIFFRDVPLPFSYALDNLKEIRWRVGNIAMDTHARVVMDSLHVCANCHSFSADGGTLGMDVDAHSDKDAYGITDIVEETTLYKMLHWSEFQDGDPTYGLLANISPDGEYIAATLKDNEFFITRPDLAYSQLFFPIKGILVICDRDKEKYWSLPGANNKEYVQTNPSWSPDGETLLFARAEAIPSKESGFRDAFDKDTAVFNDLADEFVMEGREFKYDVYKIPFNDGKGGTPEPLACASDNDMSNYFPRMSPDGKWIVFTRAENFMLLQPDSKLYITSRDGKEARLMNCNTSNMNSWHSWSPNGRWLVFSSKERGPYTRLYLTHIDENGWDSPPVLIENFLPKGRAANIPEFVNIKPGDLKVIHPKFLEHDYFLYQNGVNKIAEGNLSGAIEDFTKAMETDSNNFKLYGSRGYCRMELGNAKGALADFNKGLKMNPKDAKLYNLRGFAKIELKDYKGAIEDFTKSIEINPYGWESYNSRGYVNVILGRYKAAIPDFKKAIKHNPKCYQAHYERGVAYVQLGRYDMAIKDFNSALRIRSNFPPAYYQRGIAEYYSGQQEKACKDLNKAKKLGLQVAEQAIEQFCRENEAKGE